VEYDRTNLRLGLASNDFTWFIEDTGTFFDTIALECFLGVEVTLHCHSQSSEAVRFDSEYNDFLLTFSSSVLFCTTSEIIARYRPKIANCSKSTRITGAHCR